MGLTHRYNENLSISANAQFTKNDYNPGSDDQEQNYFLGVTYRLTRTITLNAEGGIVLTKFGDTDETDTGFRSRVALTKTSDRSTISLSFTKDVIAGTDAGETLDSQGISLRLMRVLSPDWNVSLTSSYFTYESLETDTTDEDELRISAEISYRVAAWANLALSYSYTDFEDNNESTGSYENNVVLLRLNLSHQIML
jgi:hypothetical protein